MSNKSSRKCFRFYKMPIKRELFINKMAGAGWEIKSVGMCGFLYTFDRQPVKDYYYKIFKSNHEEIPLFKKYKQNGAEFMCKVGCLTCFRLEKKYVSIQDSLRDLKIGEGCSFFICMVFLWILVDQKVDIVPNNRQWISLEVLYLLTMSTWFILFIYDAVRLGIMTWKVENDKSE